MRKNHQDSQEKGIEMKRKDEPGDETKAVTQKDRKSREEKETFSSDDKRHKKKPHTRTGRKQIKGIFVGKKRDSVSTQVKDTIFSSLSSKTQPKSSQQFRGTSI